MKSIKGRYNLISTIIITIMVFVMLVTTSFAWFTLKDKANISFTAGSCDIMLYSSLFEGELETGSYVWDDGLDLEQKDTIFGKEYLSPDYVTHLGTIDNLAFRTEANNIWYCLKVNKTTGSQFSLRLSLNDDDTYKMFSNLENSPEQVKEGDSEEARKAINKVDELIEQLIFVDSVIVTTVGVENFFESVELPDPDQSADDKKSVVKFSNSDAKSFVGNVNGLDLSDTNYYYIYFRAYPNLDAYADLVDHISVFMPCVIQFGLKVSLVVDNVL